jgi:hypothetical protein
MCMHNYHDGRPKFNSNKLQDESYSIPSIWMFVCDILGTMKSMLTLYKSLTNLTYTKFNELLWFNCASFLLSLIYFPKDLCLKRVAIEFGAKPLLRGLRFPSTTSHTSKFIIYDAPHSLIIPFMRRCLLFNTFHVACPSMAFIWIRTSSFYNPMLYICIFFI